MNIPIYNCQINEDDETGIYAMSFVDSPANEVDFIKLTAKIAHLSKDEAKQILTGVVLRPNQLIYRFDESGEYYITFSETEIEKISQKMMRTGIALQNTTHQHEEQLKGNYLTEIWIVADPENDKSKALGFFDLPKGTLMCSYKIADRNYWDKEVMTGNVKGFSLEGLFLNKLIKSKLKKMDKPKNVWQKLADLFSEEGMEAENLETAPDAVKLEDYELSDGKIASVDDDKFTSIDGEPAPEGEHTLKDGRIMVIDANSMLVEIKDAEPAPATPPQTLSAHEKAKAKAKLAKESGEAKNELSAKLAKIVEDQKKANETAQAEITKLKAMIEKMGAAQSTKPATQTTEEKSKDPRVAVLQEQRRRHQKK